MGTKFFFKETVWREVRVKLSDEQEKEIARLIKEGKIDNGDDLYDYLYDKSIFPYHNDIDFDTATIMSKKENNNQLTLEMYFSVDVDKKTEPDVTN
jgi:hypothetical protein